MEGDGPLGDLPAASNLMERKQPRTDTERVVCLAYCLSNILHCEQFTGRDIARLNERLGLPRLSNPSFAVRKARARGLLADSSSGTLRLSQEGQCCVEALPR
jgi:hypothetical protein